MVFNYLIHTFNLKGVQRSHTILDMLLHFIQTVLILRFMFSSIFSSLWIIINPRYWKHLLFGISWPSRFTKILLLQNLFSMYNLWFSIASAIFNVMSLGICSCWASCQIFQQCVWLWYECTPCSLILQLFFFLALVISFAFLNKQVVGGIDDQIPSLPSTTGVQVVTYSKLLSQVIN